ncbi:hypothetical protein Tco_1023241 [Tanacetum coccineum]
MFQQHHGESLSEARTHFKDLLQKVPYHGIDLWLQVQIFYDRIERTNQMVVDCTTRRQLRKISAGEAWKTIEDCTTRRQYKEEELDDPISSKKGSLDYENGNIKLLLESIECLEAFVGLVMNFILDQKDKIRQPEECMGMIWDNFMQLSLDYVKILKEVQTQEFEHDQSKKIQKITKYPDTENLDSRTRDTFHVLFTQEKPLCTQESFSSKPLCVGYVRVILPNPPLIRKSTFGFKPGAG